MAAQTTTSLSATVSTYYERVFLKKAEFKQIHKQGGQKRTTPTGEGKTVNFTRHTPLAVATTALTEGTNPSEVNLTASTVAATLGEYGNTVKISRFLSLVDIDANNKEKIEVVGLNMGETLDTITRNELFTGATAQLGNAKAALTDVAATDIFDAAEIRKAVRTLKTNDAIEYTEGNYSWVCKTGPFPAYDLSGDSTWVNADVNDNSAKNTYAGDLGVLYGVRFWESSNQYTESSTVTVYSNFIHGQEAFGCVDLEGDKPQLYIIPHTKIDSGNPAGRFSLVSWAASYVTKTLNSNWIVNVKTGATA